MIGSRKYQRILPRKEREIKRWLRGSGGSGRIHGENEVSFAENTEVRMELQDSRLLRFPMSPNPSTSYLRPFQLNLPKEAPTARIPILMCSAMAAPHRPVSCRPPSNNFYVLMIINGERMGDALKMP